MRYSDLEPNDGIIMGKYINRGNSDFAEARDERYVDKSGLVAFVNKALLTQERMICVSLKFGGSTWGAIEQINDRRYPTIVSEFTGNILLVGINYDEKTKKHECRIERWGESPSLSLSKQELITKLSLSSAQVDLLVESLSKPVSAKELHLLLGFKDATYFKRKVIDVLSCDGLIAMTQPDKFTSPIQKYYLTEKGKISLNKYI